ncbi:MAG: SpoIIE family protein phosphatase, partial [Leptolyngbyaceae cyanobacterium SU_3_3]|nr:SpoIIE family protein phosphatase [Leptolyngbyaceae cyanobacterium SU_3_3]
RAYYIPVTAFEGIVFDHTMARVLLIWRPFNYVLVGMPYRIARAEYPFNVRAPAGSVGTGSVHPLRVQTAGSVNVMIKGEAELAKGEYVSSDFFRGLAISPAAGRLIVADDVERELPSGRDQFRVRHDVIDEAEGQRLVGEHEVAGEAHLHRGDVCLLYTDGITEARNLQKDCYGLERLCETVQRYWHLSAKEVQRAVIQDVQQFIGEQDVNDDLTLLVIKQK